MKYYAIGREWNVKEEVDCLTVLTAALDRMHAAALEALEQLRRNQGHCIICGDYLVVKDEDYCVACFDKQMSRVMDERKHPDQR